MHRLHLSDTQRDAHALALAMTAILTVYFIGSAAHNGLYHEVLATPGPNPVGPRVLANIVATALMLILAQALLVARQSTWLSAAPRLLLAALAAALGRALVQGAFDVLPEDRLGLWVAEFTLGTLYVVGAGVLGFAYMLGRRRVRIDEREIAAERLQRELALVSLGDEEVRVRRSVAEGLHGGLQQRLVIQVVRLDAAISQAQKRSAPEEDIAHLVQLRRDLDEIREHDVREMSRMLFPEGIEIGLVPALRSLLRRLPPGIATRLEVSDEFRTLDDPTASSLLESERLLLVRIVEDAITNGLRHGRASGFEVWVAVDGADAVIDVVNNGLALDGNRSSVESGMSRLRTRIEIAGGSVAMGNVGEIVACAGGPSSADPTCFGVLVAIRLPLASSVPPA